MWVADEIILFALQDGVVEYTRTGFVNIITNN